MANKDNGNGSISWKTVIETTFQAIKNLGNSGRTNEIKEEVLNIYRKTDDSYSLNDENEQNIDNLKHYISFALSMLETCGSYLVHTSRGIWEIAPGKEDSQVNGTELYKEWTRTHKKSSSSSQSSDSNEIQDIEEIEKEEEPVWRKQLRERIYSLDPTEFEYFIRNFLRGIGFLNVTVTQRTSDCGIDGIGTYMINDIIPMNIVFQCKHYEEEHKIGRPDIQQFRGSIGNNNTIGLYVTTSSFNERARAEANDRAYSTQIVLLDGDELIDLLCKYEIGVKKIVLEPEYEIDENFFNLVKNK